MMREQNNSQTIPDQQAVPAVSAENEAFVRIVDVVKNFGEHVALNQVSLAVRKNELFALLGSSGCGKSTLLRILAGFETASSGKILVDGEELSQMPSYRRPVNMMFQSYALFPHMTVEANVAFGLKQEGLGKKEIAERVQDALDLVQMRKYAKRKPHQLSGGQQQRVALIRSLVKRPKLLLLDEPMSALDKKIRQKTQLELVSIIEKVDVTCIMVTHDQEEAMTMATRLAVMSEGEVIQVGTPSEVYEYPKCRFSAEFIGTTNLFDGVVARGGPDHVLIDCPALAMPLSVNHGVSGPLGMPVSVSVRPERVRLHRKKPAQVHNVAHGVVHDMAYLGSYTLYHVKLDSGKVIIANLSSLQLESDEAPGYGDEVHASWNESGMVVLTS